MTDDAIETPVPTPALTPTVVIRPLLLAAIGTLAVGVLAGRRDLIRGGLRLGAVQLTAAALDTAVRRLESPDSDIAAPPPMVIEAMATWLAETLVTAAFDRFEPAPANQRRLAAPKAERP